MNPLGTIGNINIGSMPNLGGLTPQGNEIHTGSFAENLNKFMVDTTQGVPQSQPMMLKGGVAMVQDAEGEEQPNDSKIFANGASAQDVANKFSNLMGDYLNNVNQKNIDAEKAVETFASGGDIDIHSVMIASEKANLAMQLTMQLRSKILQAYQEIQNVRV